MDVASVALACLIVGCSGPTADAGPDARPSPDAAPAPRQAFRACRDRTFTPAPAQAWRHSIATPLTTMAGAANHSAQDELDPTGSTATLHGKFAYGLVSKDLEDELVRVWIDDCARWRELGDFVTDGDGRIEVPVPALATPGVYAARFEVLGDQSMTSALVWVLPAGTHVVVTDIDATLTTSDFELFEQVLDGSHVPAAYPGAVDLTRAHAGLGQIVVYLTGRPYWLTARTREWLDDLWFAPGPIHVADSNGEAMPTEGGVGELKRRFVTNLIANGYVIDVAYGNASTDLYAYLEAGIAADRTWIIGSHGGEQGTHAVDGGWVARAVEVSAAPAITQPFDW